VALWVFWDGTGSSGSSSIHIDASGAVINLLLLIPLSRGREWAKWILTVQGIFSAVFIGSLKVPPFGGPSFGILAYVAALQVALLVSLGDVRSGRAAPARPAS
jgi:hypothetical protein